MDDICAGGAPDAIGTKMFSLAGIELGADDALLIVVGDKGGLPDVIVPVGNGCVVSWPVAGRFVLIVYIQGQ